MLSHVTHLLIDTHASSGNEAVYCVVYRQVRQWDDPWRRLCLINHTYHDLTARLPYGWFNVFTIRPLQANTSNDEFDLTPTVRPASVVGMLCDSVSLELRKLAAVIFYKRPSDS